MLDQIVDGDTGLLVPAGDAHALAQAHVDARRPTPPLRERMGAAARSRFEAEFAADVVIDRIEAIYRRLAAVPGSAALPPRPPLLHRMSYSSAR